jgi:hypothetical protein
MCQIVSCQELSRERERERESRRSEFRESAVEGIRLCQEDLVCELKTVRVIVIFEVTVRL